VDANPVSRNLKRLLTSFDETGGIERLMDYIFFQTTAINGFDSVSHYLRAGLIAAAGCVPYATSITFGCESTFGEAKVAGASAGTGTASAKIAPHLADRPAPSSAPPIKRTLADRIDEILSLEDPDLEAQRNAEIDRIREGVKEGPQGPYGDPKPFLDYLLGNDE
jgi:hypothetical protein